MVSNKMQNLMVRPTRNLNKGGDCISILLCESKVNDITLICSPGLWHSSHSLPPLCFVEPFTYQSFGAFAI